jgi:hypothetical protein
MRTQQMLISQNIVLAARQFQPSTIGEHWLMVNGVATAIYGNKISTEMVSSHSTSRFDIMVLPDKATFAFKSNIDVDLAINEVRQFIQRSTDPRYWAIGFNFAYRLTPDGADGASIREFSQRFQLTRPCQGLHGNMAIWGSLVICPGPHGSAVRLQIAPSFPNQNPIEPPQMLIAEFNVNFHIGDENRAEALAALDHFHDCANHVCAIQAQLVQQ